MDTEENSNPNKNNKSEDDTRFVFSDKVSSRIIEDMIRAVEVSEKGWKLIVVDSTTVKILDSTIQMKDLCKERVFLVENIEIPRKPIHEAEVIYFLSPSRESIKHLLEDFSSDKPNGLYGPIHLFFTGRVQNNEFNKIKESQIINHIKTFKELNIDLLVFESQIFHFGRPDSFQALFSPDMTGSASIEEKEIAEKLVSVCATLDEYPVIQYQNSERCSNIAKHLQDRLDSIKKTSDEYAKKSRSQEASILLILDRTFDPLSPLLHEFTYQAMCYDLLSLPGNHFSYTSETVKGEQRQKKVLLSEKDPLWRDFRHTHIADINNTLSDDFNRFLAKHQPSKFQQTNNLGIGQMSAAIKALPQFTEELSRYTCHIELSTQCNTEFKTQQLKDIGPIEQLMATGEDDEGKTVKNLIPLLSPLLEDEKISLENKLRLFMLYIISQEGIKESNRNKLLEICRFDTKDTFAVTNLKYLGVSLEKGPTRSKKKAERNSEYNLSRYIPPLKIIGSSLISGEVLKDFKYVRKEDAKRFIPTNLNQESDVKSRRSNHQAKWGKKEKKEKEVLEKEKKTAELKGGRVMIFVAGGISFSEIRVAYELSAKFKREVILGGTEILTPKSYIENIRLLKTTIGE